MKLVSPTVAGFLPLELENRWIEFGARQKRQEHRARTREKLHPDVIGAEDALASEKLGPDVIGVEHSRANDGADY